MCGRRGSIRWVEGGAQSGGWKEGPNHVGRKRGSITWAEGGLKQVGGRRGSIRWVVGVAQSGGWKEGLNQVGSGGWREDSRWEKINAVPKKRLFKKDFFDLKNRGPKVQ